MNFTWLLSEVQVLVVRTLATLEMDTDLGWAEIKHKLSGLKNWPDMKGTISWFESSIFEKSDCTTAYIHYVIIFFCLSIK